MNRKHIFTAVVVAAIVAVAVIFLARPTAQDRQIRHLRESHDPEPSVAAGTASA